MDREAGFPDYALSRVVNGKVTLRTDFLFHALDMLGEDPATFMAEALGPARVNAVRLLEEIETEHRDSPDPFVDLPSVPLPEPTDEPGVVDTELEERVDRLDELRVLDPVASLEATLALWNELVERAVADPSRANVALACRCLGALASATGARSGGFEAAARCLRLGLIHAMRHELARARADLLQRTAYLLGHKGRRQIAVLLAFAAREEYLLAGDDVGVAKALITLGTMQQRAGRPVDAIASLRAGVARLPRWIWWGHEGAHQHLALAALATGQTLEADRELRRAGQAAGEQSGAFQDRLTWIGGEIALARGENAEAADRLERARGAMADRHPLEKGLVCLRLALAYLRLGRQEELRRLCAELVSLLQPLARERLAVEALTEVTRAVMTGEVREKLLQAAAARMWRGYHALAEYPLQFGA